MKIEMFFLITVLGIAAIHLLFSLVSFMTRHRQVGVQKKREGEKRLDWYVFFEKSSLYGDKAPTAIKPEVVGEDVKSDLVYEDNGQLQESYT